MGRGAGEAKAWVRTKKEYVELPNLIIVLIPKLSKVLFEKLCFNNRYFHKISFQILKLHISLKF